MSKSLILFAALLLSVVVLAPVYAETGASVGLSAASDPDDCDDLRVRYQDGNRLLTRAEQFAEMERAFYESLGRFERCTSGPGLSNSSGKGGAGAGAGAGTNAGTVSGTVNGNVGAVNSAPVRSVSGESDDAGEAISGAADQGLPDGREGGDEGTTVSATKASTATTKRPEKTSATALGSGKIPDDIPPADNDSALQAQIRAKALAETNPERRKKLWDEYRKYQN